MKEKGVLHTVFVLFGIWSNEKVKIGSFLGFFKSTDDRFRLPLPLRPPLDLSTSFNESKKYLGDDSTTIIITSWTTGKHTKSL